MPLFATPKRQSPATVATDDIIPVHLFDGSSATRGILQVWTYKFDDVLDPRSLHDALTKLFQMDGWRKFSGRLRLREDGKLEIHVPEKATKARPAVLLSTEDHDFPMTEHPLASTIPDATGNLTTFPGPRTFTPLGMGPETPRTLDDFLYSDKPQFCLHVQTFTDGTIIGLTATHISSDLLGLTAIFKAWSNILANKPDAVPPMIGYRDDPFDGLRSPPAKEPHILADKVLQGWRFKYWAMRSLYESWRSVETEARSVRIPGHVMDAIVKDAKHDISYCDKFISKGDIITALACRIRARAEKPGSTREVMTIMALDPRGPVKSVFRDDAVYIQNTPTNIYFSCPADQAQQLPLGELALMVRDAIRSQTTEEQVRANVALSVETMKTTDLPVIFGEKDMATQFMSNWTKANVMEWMDFSPAIVKGAAEPRAPHSRHGRPVYWSGSDPSHNTVSVISSLFVVVREDSYNNTWMTNTLPKNMWLDFMDLLERYDLSVTGGSRDLWQPKSRL